MSVAEGSTLAHFKITAKLGEGGMGVVWRAEDTELGREVAIKVLPPEMAADPDRLDRFRREAQSVAALNHPNIVTLHTVEEDGGVHFLVLELIEGQSLDRVVPRLGLDINGLFELAIPIADALAAAHENGITHRDLKPANVMVRDSGLVKILDFGLAKLAEKPGDDQATEFLTKEGTLLGTVPYMSPEQVQGREADHRSDIFSFGILLYEMATGRRPFGGEDPASVISSILRDQPRPVTELKSDLPNHLGRIVRRCLEKDPESRFQSAKEVRIELEDLKREIAAPASGVDVRVWRPAPGQTIPHRPRWTVVEKLGEGAFGEVWLAEHAKTGDRRVFKFCFEAARLEALQREITFIRLLKEELGQRDDIAGILDWNFDEPPWFVESEYTEGGDLAQWVEAQGGLDQVPLPVRLEIVAQVATALAAAHSVGVLHKDLQPASVLITADTQGRPTARLTDFGVGELVDRRRRVASAITTGAPRGTERPNSSDDGGSRLYMAPEVAAGGARTLQADVYSLGVLLYQMVVGDLSRPIGLDWEVDLDDDLLRQDIAWAVDSSPERRLKNALRIAERLRSLDTRREEAGSQADASAERSRSRETALSRVVLPWLAVASGLVGAYLLGTTVNRTPAPAVLRSTLLSDQEWAGLQGQLALSPDGRQLAYSAFSEEDGWALSVRSLADGVERRLEGTENAQYPFWSPNSQALGFFAEKQLKRIDVKTGGILALCEAEDGRGGTWGHDEAGDEIIVFAPGPAVGLMEIAAQGGGSPRPVTRVEDESESHRWPRLVSVGWLLYMNHNRADGEDGLWILDREKKESRRLVPRLTDARYAAGNLLFERDGDLVARRFDVGRGDLVGGPQLVVRDIEWHPARWNVSADASDNILVYRHPQSAESRLVWFDEAGIELEQVGEPADYGDLAIAPGGDRAVVNIPSSHMGGRLWIVDLADGSRRRFSRRENAFHGRWSPDGTRIAFSTFTDGMFEIVVQDLDEAADELVLASGKSYKLVTQWSRDGRFLVYHQQTKSGHEDIWAARADASASAFQVIATPASETGGALSDDGRWILYQSDAGGSAQVFLSRFPDGSATRQVSSDGGFDSWWSLDGDSIIYLDPGFRLIRIPATLDDSRVHLEAPVVFLEGRTLGDVFGLVQSVDQDPVNRRWLVSQVGSDSGSERIELIANWTALLDQ